MNIVIIGGGPAGMLAAIAASKSIQNSFKGTNIVPEVLLIEKNEKLGKKLFITGKGRCNLTNNCEKEEFFKNIVTNPKFLYSAYSEFTNNDLMKLVEDNGCQLKTERGNRVFPVSDKSYDVLDALKKALRDNKVIIKLNTEVIDLKCKRKYISVDDSISDKESENIFEITTNKNEKIVADKVIVATGGLSYPSTGATGDGYRFAKKFDISVVNQSPSLVPFDVKELDECVSMQGLTLKNIAIKIIKNNKIIYKDFGELLFTHFGVSGPVIISASSYIDVTNDDKIIILSIDLKPALDEDKLDDRLIRDFESNKNKKLKNVIEGLLPSSMVDVFLDRLNALNSKINTCDLRISEVSKEVRNSMISLLKDFRFTITSKRGFDEAIITRGGIDVKEINPKTMESKSIKGLYFAGEVLDIDALTGGFNIQIAATTGYVAGAKAANDI